MNDFQQSMELGPRLRDRAFDLRKRIQDDAGAPLFMVGMRNIDFLRMALAMGLDAIEREHLRARG